MALREALNMVPGLRKQIGQRDERVAIKFVSEMGGTRTPSDGPRLLQLL
jgi:hypothetical protein